MVKVSYVHMHLFLIMYSANGLRPPQKVLYNEARDLYLHQLAHKSNNNKTDAYRSRLIKSVIYKKMP